MANVLETSMNFLQTQDPEIAACIENEFHREAEHRADRLGEHRLPGRHRRHGFRPDEQIRRGLSRQAVLRRLRLRRRAGEHCDGAR